MNRVTITPSLPQQMDPLLRQALTDVLRQYGQQINWTAFDILRATTSQSIGHDLVLADATAGVLAFTLPKADTFFDRVIRIKKTDASVNILKVVPSNSEKLDGTSTVTISAQYSSLQIISDGSAWHII